MKTIKYLYTGFLVFSLVCFSSCQLTGDLDDETIEYALDAETAIVDENSANLALTGAYAGLLGQGSLNSLDYIVIPSTLCGTVMPAANAGLEEDSYNVNDPLTIETNGNINSYALLYGAVSRANWIIEKVEELSDADFAVDTRRAEMIAEAKGIRATAHFYLLRIWGEFYDVNSSYGIPIRMEPVRSEEAFPRSTVAETYAAIISDLDDVIASAPDFTERYFITKTYGKGMKAKVLLHRGDSYAEAATLAQEVIDSSPADFALAADFASIFDQTTTAIFDNTDIIFGSHLEPSNSGAQPLWYSWNLYNQVSPLTSTLAAASTAIGAQNILHDSYRISSMQGPWWYGILNFKLGYSGGYKTINHLRISEVYLIRAEAAARAAGSVTTEALDALNAIRVRVGATSTGADGFETYPVSITLDEFLEAVRIEKTMELFGEMGEEWFDLVRYDYIDGFGSGFQASDIKPSATDAGKFILPIDEVTIASGGNVVAQSPGYN